MNTAKRLATSENVHLEVRFCVTNRHTDRTTNRTRERERETSQIAKSPRTAKHICETLDENATHITQNTIDILINVHILIITITINITIITVTLQVLLIILVLLQFLRNTHTNTQVICHNTDCNDRYTEGVAHIPVDNLLE